MAEFTNNAANATISKILSLLSKPTDEHILAGLTLLSKLKENPPSPKSVVDALSTRGMNFLKRLVLTGVKDESKRGYVDLSLSTYLFLAPTLSLNATTTTTLLSILDLRMPVDIQRRLHAITVLRKGFKSPTNEVMTKVVGIVVECEIRKAKSTTEDEWAEANMTGLLKEAEGFVWDGLKSHQSANLDPILAFLKISTNLDLCLKILDSILVRGNESRLMKKFSSKLPSVCRRLIVTGLRLEALDKPDPQTPRDVSLHLLGRLLETCGGKWITDAVADNNPLKISVRVACGELRLHLAEVLDLAEAKSGPDVDERLQLFENKISVCIQVFLCATKHLIEIMDDDRADSADWASLPYDVLIHLKGSLDDGVDAMVQLLGEDVVHSGKLNVKVEEIMLLCVKPVGAWYAENEIETEYSRNMVAGAYHNAVILCDGGFSSAGGTNEDEEADSDDEEVPPSPPSQSNIFFLLPALAKVLNERSSHNDFVSVKLASNPKIIDIFLKFLKGACQRTPLIVTEVAWAVDVLEGCSAHVDDDTIRNKIGVEMGGLARTRSGALVFILRGWFTVVSTIRRPKIDKHKTILQESLRYYLKARNASTDERELTELCEIINQRLPLFDEVFGPEEQELRIIVQMQSLKS